MMEMEIYGSVRRCSTDVSESRRRVVSEDGYLADWLLMEILCRIPIKLVFRCKCVSRRWLSLISDPSFARFYITSRGLASDPWVFIFKRMYAEGCKLSYFSEEKLLEIMYPPANSPPSPNYLVLPLRNPREAAKEEYIYFIQAVHNGLVLYKWMEYKGTGELYICNPMTNQWFPLPRPKYGGTVSVGFITQVEAAGVLTCYRVVLIRCHPQKQYSLEFEVFCSESGEWVEYTVWVEEGEKMELLFI